MQDTSAKLLAEADFTEYGGPRITLENMNADANYPFTYRIFAFRKTSYGSTSVERHALTLPDALRAFAKQLDEEREELE